MSFVKHRQNPRRAVPGMLQGEGQDRATGFATERIPFGSWVIQDSGDEKGRLRLGSDSDVIADLRGVAKFSQLTERPYDPSLEPGYPLNWSFTYIRKGKIWVPADTDLTTGDLFLQLSVEGTRETGKLYQTVSTTAARSLNVTAIASVYEDEVDDVALIEIFIR